MRIRIGTGNRITIPKQFMLDNDIEANRDYEMKYIDGKIVIDVSGIAFKETQDVQSINKEYTQDNVSKSSIQIVSNLEQGEHFSRKVYSPCNLVIRTKRKYLDKFCEQCKGKLYNDYNLQDSSCPYISKSISDDVCVNNSDVANNEVNVPIKQNIIKEDVTQISTQSTHNSDQDVMNTVMEYKQHKDELINNISKINNTINNHISQHIVNSIPTKKINTTSKKIKHRNMKVRSSNTTVQPVIFDNYKRCTECGQFKDMGFLIDDKFYCKSCAVKDFTNYFNTIKAYRKEN